MGSRDDEFERFFLTNYDAVVRTLTLMTGDHERATDAAQEAFIRAYARWGTIRSYDLPGAWVRRIAINYCRDLHRSEVRRRRREQPHVAGPVDSPADGVVADASAVELLAGLPRGQREVATLFYVDDCGVDTIASILGISTGTVKSQLAEARSRLRAMLDGDGGGE